jgi:PEP-CTERM motif
MSQKEQDAMFKFACEALPVPTFDVPLTGQLVPIEFPPSLPDVPTATAELTTPPELAPPPEIPTPPGGDTGTDSPGYPYPPIFFPAGGGPGSGPPPGNSPAAPPIVPPVTPPVVPPVTPPIYPPPLIPTPEPGSFVLLGTGVAALWAVRRNMTRSEA